MTAYLSLAESDQAFQHRKSGSGKSFAAVRRIARTALAAVGIPVTVTGLDHLPRGNAVLVFNHLSYADVLLLAAVLPGEPAYVAKRELAGQIFAGHFCAGWRRRSSIAMMSAAAWPIPMRHCGGPARPQHRVLSGRDIQCAGRRSRRARHPSWDAVDAPF